MPGGASATGEPSGGEVGQAYVAGGLGDSPGAVQSAVPGPPAGQSDGAGGWIGPGG
jgi:hypothetical protein